GKELVARALHANSRRSRGPFVAVNCGALPESLLESELFGHERGAFTGAVKDNPGWFERAQGGTLFLDEVGELAPALQAKLLRVLESGEYARVGSTRIRQADARIVAATHQDLEERVEEGSFRRDFLFRLNVLEVKIPPLRERPSDLPLLVRHFLERLRPEGSPEPLKLEPEAEELLARYPFPGNVRELAHALQRAVLLSDGPRIEARHLPEVLHRPGPTAPSFPPGEDFKSAKGRVLEAFEREYLSRALTASGGNIRRAAAASDLDYKNFHTKLKTLGIDAAAFKGT
ncbi:MAG: sigma-54-dependent Fis family transcriptional regulator, partial [Acidobacteria bacterium]|nr:sigma-54-dependent Fis family transcriptional regulator [Acidobacteriota bacterium]